MSEQNFIIEIKNPKAEETQEALGIDFDDFTERMKHVSLAYKDDVDSMVESNCEEAELIRSVSFACKTKEELAFACFEMGKTHTEVEMKNSFERFSLKLREIFDDEE